MGYTLCPNLLWFACKANCEQIIILRYLVQNYVKNAPKMKKKTEIGAQYYREKAKSDI